MKLKEGMYIRFKRYTGAVSIGQIFDVDIDKYNFCLSIDLGNSRLLFFDKEDIVKYSFDLIDLIEVGDYVNGYKVIDVIDFDIYGKKITDREIVIDKLGYTAYRRTILSNADIKSVVTKEMFEKSEFYV